MWRAEDISIELDDEMTSDVIMTVAIATPVGLLTFMSEPEVLGSTLVLHGTHAQDGRANAVGAANLKVLARAVMERLGIDELIVKGALRTTGANPGRRPRDIRFTRRVCPPTAGG